MWSSQGVTQPAEMRDGESETERDRDGNREMEIKRDGNRGGNKDRRRWK